MKRTGLRHLAFHRVAIWTLVSPLELTLTPTLPTSSESSARDREVVSIT